MALPLRRNTQRSMAIVCAFFLMSAQSSSGQQQPAPQGQAPAANQPATLGPDQLDSLVAPVALYPDPLLSQVLVAATYPLEVVEADRWYKENSKLKGKNLTDAAAKQTWDASVQALVVFPAVLKQLDDSIDWTTDLGNAFLAQQPDVMAAVQRLRTKAQQGGKLQSTAQQKVTTVNKENVTYVEIEPANPQVIYVPTYDPVVVWGAPPVYYPYPAIVYPPVSTGAIVATAAISFGVGMAIGALWSGGGWGWHCGWSNHTVVVNNNFINNNHFNHVNVSNNNVWQHNSVHRQGVPYANRNVANRYNNVDTNRINRPSANQTQQRLGQADRQVGQGNANRQTGQGAAGAQRNQTRTPDANRGQGSGDRIGNRQVGGGNSGGGHAFGDMNGGGGRAQMNRSRGAASFGSRRR
jgi:hypothetical protein